MNMIEKELVFLNSLKRRIEDQMDVLRGLADDTPVPVGPHMIGKGPKVGIIVGHTASSPGAPFAALNGVYEYQWNSDLAAKILAVPTALDRSVFFRDKIGASGAYRAAKAFGAKAIIELHFNSFTSPSATGTVTLYDQPHDRRLAELVHKNIVAAMELRDRGLSNISIENNMRGASLDDAAQEIPSIITEPFFGSNLADCARAQDRKGALAIACIRGLEEFLGV